MSWEHRRCSNACNMHQLHPGLWSIRLHPCAVELRCFRTPPVSARQEYESSKNYREQILTTHRPPGNLVLPSLFMPHSHSHRTSAPPKTSPSYLDQSQSLGNGSSLACARQQRFTHLPRTNLPLTSLSLRLPCPPSCQLVNLGTAIPHQPTSLASQTYLLTSPSNLPTTGTMGGTTWTSDRDQRLFLLLVDQIQVNPSNLATAWKAKYGKSSLARASSLTP